MVEKTHKPQVCRLDSDQLLLSNIDFSVVLKSVLTRGVQVRFRARGNSMIPFILDGDFLTIASVEQETPAVGKVVAYNQPETGYLIVHRVVGGKDGRFLIKGDNSNERGECGPLQVRYLDV